MWKAVRRFARRIMPKCTLMPDMTMPFETEYQDLGVKEYKAAWDIQEITHAAIVEKKKQLGDSQSAGTLIFCEHPHVFTLGKSGEANNLLVNDDFLKKINASYFKSNRGGDITYHGPGQLVGYPIFDLEALKIGVKEYIHKVEKAIILTLADYSIKAGVLEGATGVWLDAESKNTRKICAIGVRVSNAVTMHGFALNINTDLNYFSYINPCGFLDKGVTSMQKELGKTVDFEEIKSNLKSKIGEVFSLEFVTISF
jgi:lipoyl(octanoyl) transferase